MHCGIILKKMYSTYKVAVVLLYFLFCIFIKGNAQIIIEQDKTPEALVKEILLGSRSGIKVTEVKFTGNPISIGTYYTFSKEMPISKGIVLTTGRVEDVDGPNESPNTGSAIFTLGNKNLQMLTKSKTADAVTLQFTFYPNTNRISFYYSFASEEYPEYVKKGVNDAFAFFISGTGYENPTNIALVPGTNVYVSIDNINENTNAEFYLENKQWNNANKPFFASNLAHGERSYNCEFDGMTIKLEASAEVVPFQPYVLTLAIADVGDNLFDSGVFIQKESLKSNGDTLAYLHLIQKDIAELMDTSNIFSLKKEKDTIKIVSNIQFAFNSHELDKEYYEPLIAFCKLFNQYFELKIKLLGHSDDVGSEEYNMQLSAKRAEAVYEFLLKQGVDKNRMEYIGKGNLEPIYKDTTEHSRILNRRVEFVLF